MLKRRYHPFLPTVWTLFTLALLIELFKGALPVKDLNNLVPVAILGIIVLGVWITPVLLFGWYGDPYNIYDGPDWQKPASYWQNRLGRFQKR